MAKRKHYLKIFKRNKNRSQAFFIAKLIGLASLAGMFFLLILFLVFAKDLPRPEKFTEKQFIQSTKIYDRTGDVLLYEIYGEEKRTLVSLDEMPEHLKAAVIATEDAGFYHHFGIDPRGIFRSILINLKLQEPMYGGSTIAQQLIRSTFFTTEKTITRKIREIVLALELDRRYSKDQILEWYLNQVPFGSNAYGVEAASQTYFEKSVSEISIAEAATLAAVIQAPSLLSPYGSYTDRLMARKNYVLERMVEEGYLTEEEMITAKAEKLDFKESLSIKAPHFVIYILENYLKPKYGQDLTYLKENGIKIYTSLDWELQEAAEKIVKEGSTANQGFNAYNAALLSIDPKTGEILAMVGSADWFAEPLPEGCVGVECKMDPEFNITVGTKSSPGRQPGSAFKPFAYAAALNNGSTATTTVSDQETNFGIWGEKEYIPQNYDGNFRGEVTLREALSQSLNIPSIKTLYLAGIDEKIENLEINDFLGKESVIAKGLERSVAVAKDLGITTLDKPLSAYGPAIVLGGGEVRLLDMVSAYGVLANDGLGLPPVSILRVEDYQGNIIDENKKTQKRVLSSETARILNDILSDNQARSPMFGLSSPLYFPGYEVAAKTGTTQDYRDAWTLGYSPTVVTGVWVGNSNNDAMREKPGVVLAGPIFHRFMEQALAKFPKENFLDPK